MQNLKGELLCLETNGLKPNYSELARIYGKDRRTIKKEYLGFKTRSVKKKEKFNVG